MSKWDKLIARICNLSKDLRFTQLQKVLETYGYRMDEKMKTLNEYMSMSYKMEIIEDQDEGGFVISYPDLPGCITCGETIESAMQNAKDAKREWIRAALEEGIEIYEPDSLENYSGQFKLRIPRSLHRSLAEHSQKEGISMNQYCVYLLSKNDVMYSK